MNLNYAIGADSRRAASTGETPARHTDTEKLKRTAREFEGLIIAELLKSARQGASMSSLDGGSGSDDAISGFAEQQMSQVLSSAGGFGLAAFVVQGLKVEGGTR